MSVVMMLSAAWRADHPAQSFMLFGLVAVAMLISDVARGAVTGAWAGVEFWVFVLIAEYAAIIRNVPPRERTTVQANRTAVK